MASERKAEAQRFLRELQEKAFFKERKKIEVRNAEKTARLKALRLAKEEQEAQAAASVAKAKTPKVNKGVHSRTLVTEDVAASPSTAPVLPGAEDAKQCR